MSRLLDCYNTLPHGGGASDSHLRKYFTREYPLLLLLVNAMAAMDLAAVLVYTAARDPYM